MTRRSRALGALAALLAATGVLLAGPAGRHPVAAASAGGSLAFVMGPDNTPYADHLYTSADDGSGLRRVSDARAALAAPSYSPDGSRIAFAAAVTDGTDGRWGIDVVGVDGSGLHRLTAPRYADLDPAWSPDGQSIAFTRYLNGSFARTNRAIFVMHADGTGVRQLPGTAGGQKPSWSPDSRLIVYDAADGLRVADADGSTGQALIFRGLATDPAWSPDGSRVAFVAIHGPGSTAVAVVPSHGGGATVLTNVGGAVENPRWSADSKTLWFVHYAGQGEDGRTGSDVWRVPAAGGTPGPAVGFAADVHHLDYEPPTVPVQRLAGADRYATAADVALAAYPHADQAVVASGQVFPDGLSAAALAGSVAGPVLLVPPTGAAPSTVTAALDRMGVTQVTVVGGTPSVSEQTADSLGGPTRSVARIAGPDRVATAADVAQAIGPDRIGSWGGQRTAFLARDDAFADALAASAPAAAAVLPILLTDPATLPAPTADALQSLGVQQVVIVGSTASVSAAVEAQVRALGITTVRYAGPNRYGTATALASALVQAAPAGLGFTTGRFALARGTTFPDALAGGPLAAVRREPILFSAPGPPLPPDTTAYAAAHKSTVTAVDVFGGTPSVPTSVLVDLQRALR